MVSFESDYTQGAHEKILQRFVETNLEKLPGYGSDMYCERAKEKIKMACECEDAQVFLLTGGTQTNAIIIDAMLRPYEGVIAVDSGHINVHEAGAIERSGHKVLSLEGVDGKISSGELRKYLESFWNDDNHEHMVFPGMVYISHPTEIGTLYSKTELEEISGICHAFDIPLYMDGARLGYGLMSKETDVTLPMIAKYCDVFYIGGTKVGALCGEAVVFTKKNMPKNFLTIVKQQGALLAKGRLLGIQFDVLFTDGLYFEISKHAIDMAEKLKMAFRKRGYVFFIDSPTNQQFFILEDDVMEQLSKKVCMSFWEKYDKTHTTVRLATSWATTDEDIRQLEEILDEIER